MRFIDINNQYLMDNQRAPKLREPLSFWPSEASAVVENEIWGSCHRQVYWKAKGVPYSNSTDLLMIRKAIMGKQFEIAEIDIMTKNPAYSEIMPNYKIKVNITPEILISGELDTIAKKQGKYKIIEFKSGGGKYYRSDVFGTGEIWGAPKGEAFPKEYYLLQVMLYLDLVKRHPELKQYDLSTAEIICLDREKCGTFSHEIQLDESGYPIVNGALFPKLTIHDIYDRFKKAYYAIVNDQLPFGDFNSYISMEEAHDMLIDKKIKKWQYERWDRIGYGCDIQCTFCNYVHRCQHANGKRASFKEL